MNIQYNTYTHISCKKCKARAKVDLSTVCTSNPPKYKVVCENTECGYVDYIDCDQISTLDYIDPPKIVGHLIDDNNVDTGLGVTSYKEEPVIDRDSIVAYIMNSTDVDIIADIGSIAITRFTDLMR